VTFHNQVSPPPPTGGGWRRFQRADRDILPQQTDAEDRQEPAGRLHRPMPGVRAGAFAERGGSPQGALGDRRQRLRRLGRRTVRKNDPNKRNSLFYYNILW